MLAAAVLLGNAWAAAAGTLVAEVGGVRVELGSEPARPDAKQATVYVARLTDAGGTPVTDATVTLRGRMADGMAVLAPLRPGAEPGVYRGKVLYTMEGAWELTLRVAAKGKRFELPLQEHVER
jgi:hypothetical protein